MAIRTADSLACQAKSPVSWAAACCRYNLDAFAAHLWLSPEFAGSAEETAVRGNVATAIQGSYARAAPYRLATSDLA